MKIITVASAALFLLAGTASAVVCNDDVLVCQDGRIFSRNPRFGCEFPACPSMSCNSDIVRCRDPSTSSFYFFLTRDPDNQCNFYPCPFAEDCNTEVQQCTEQYSDIFVARDPSNSCFYLTCPSTTCNTDVDACGSARDPFNNCAFPLGCRQDCPDDTKVCDDGTIVGRNPNRNCEWNLCPGECAPDTFKCPNGSVVGREPNDNCNFRVCTTHRNPRPQSADSGAGGIVASAWLVLSSIAVPFLLS